MAQATVVTAFNWTEVVTDHPHWHKEVEDVEPIVGPLCRIVEQLPAKTLKAFEKRFNSIFLAAGAAILIVPDVIMEVKIRREERAIANEEGKGSRRGNFTPRLVNSKGEVIGSVRGNPQNDGNQNGQKGASPNDWRQTLPDEDVQVAY